MDAWIAWRVAIRHTRTVCRAQGLFASEEVAIEAGFRPCGVCMKERYQLWMQAVSRTKDGKEQCKIYRELLARYLEAIPRVALWFRENEVLYQG
ncbi:hypothetical protein EI42_02278 [Thermosporothrix hazakensis]|uniref:Metal binding Ada-like protein n=2 Tax=Thermosporothrix TaxID=768650 RepID=A0A326UHJ3_THEHA|nr:hypothetical protein [Thermosporothrix hazakensis]PZW31181.1 hypothetical protein EI42_02278 [Thermosporothrix hazakensis]BBH86599.1 hypothetical protein KTC_13500 [Thermosporothrix sp. COM3]GCE50908.1 hypothetical protein KTH_57770 [Thermosporothrix hazakensis]